MKANLFTLDNSSHDDLMSFFISIKKIKFVFKNILLLNNFKNENNLILAPPRINIKKLITSINQFKDFNLSSSCYLIPNIFKEEKKCCDVPSINYPIKINTFEHRLINFFLKKGYAYKDYNLINSNFLINNLNNKQIYLTEIESKIIKLFFKDGYVLKQTISAEVLNQQPGVESKSLESHLYRLRKKMLNLGGKQIIANGEKSIKIK